MKKEAAYSTLQDNHPLFSQAPSSSLSVDGRSDSGTSEDGVTVITYKSMITLPPQQVLSLLYFCNQRPGIFIAPVLLSQGFPESHIGIVLFVSGLLGLAVQVLTIE